MSDNPILSEDIGVLIVFFSRPDTLKKVFDKVREAKPCKLFLACDGPRNGNENDIKNISDCKKIVEAVDWDCQIFKKYSEENLGCGMFPQSAIGWAFENTEKLIVLEDDCVPHSGFFPYMSEMLEKYKNDTRIGLISGFNHMENWDTGGYSYFFTKTGPMAGAWGSWKRVWDGYRYDVHSIKPPYVQKLIAKDISFKRARKRVLEWLDTSRRVEAGEKLSYWDVQFGFLKYYQGYLSVVPKFSLASNIGLGEGSTHAKNAANTMPAIFFAPDRHLEFPLSHPDFVICDHEYDILLYRKWSYPHPLVKNFKRGCRFIKRFFNR